MIAREKLIILEDTDIRQPRDRKSCSPHDIRKQIYVSLPNQFRLLKKAADRYTSSKGNAREKAKSYFSKRKQIIDFAISRLDKGLDYIINVKLNKLAGRNFNRHVNRLIQDNKRVVATACKSIKNFETQIKHLCKTVGVPHESDYGSCADKYNHILRADPYGYHPENMPSSDFADKWLIRRQRINTINNLQYYAPKGMLRLNRG